jgi:Fe2+ transport system protein FeoA
MPVKKLSELRPGEKGKVCRIQTEPRLKRRIMDMGVIVGSMVEVEKLAPMGDPIDIRVKGYHLSLRKEEAAGILVEME